MVLPRNTLGRFSVLWVLGVLAVLMVLWVLTAKAPLTPPFRLSAGCRDGAWTSHRAAQTEITWPHP